MLAETCGVRGKGQICSKGVRVRTSVSGGDRPVVQRVIAQLRNEEDHEGMTAAETIGQRIKRERLALEMTQRELAEAVDVGVPHISKIEAGRENPSDDLLRRLAHVFKADADELLLAARRLPAPLIEDFATDPATALAFLRTWREKKGPR